MYAAAVAARFRYLAPSTRKARDAMAETNATNECCSPGRDSGK
jgi:hypothetical protein